MRIGKYKYLIIVVLFLGTIYVIVPSVNYTNCLGNQRFQEVIIDGVVIKKYLDKSQHSTPIVEVKNFEGRIDSIYFFGDHSGIFDKIEANDTLKKKRGNNKILVKKGSGYGQLGIADFECDQVKFENEKSLSWLYNIFGTVPSDNTSQKK